MWFCQGRLNSSLNLCANLGINLLKTALGNLALTKRGEVFPFGMKSRGEMWYYIDMNLIWLDDRNLGVGR